MKASLKHLPPTPTLLKDLGTDISCEPEDLTAQAYAGPSKTVKHAHISFPPPTPTVPGRRENSTRQKSWTWTGCCPVPWSGISFTGWWWGQAST